MVTIHDLPPQMCAVLLTGHGGLDRLDYRTDVPVPTPASDEVLIQVAAAGVNNTDINTRTGWYSKDVTRATDAGALTGFAEVGEAGGAWAGQGLPFPRIQGADVCGRIVAIGDSVDAGRVGERVLVRTMMRAPVHHRPFETVTLGSELDGGFAQFVAVPAAEAFRVDSDLSDEQLGVVPCSYSTAEGLLHRSGVGAERVLVTGASGGVGLAAVQLAKLRGAEVIAVCGADKQDEVVAAGADRTVERGADLVETLGSDSLDVVIDLVGGKGFGSLLDVLRPGGRCATSGAIGGPIAEVDLRTLYLKDLTLFGCTVHDDIVFENLIGYLNRGQLIPVVAQSYPLHDIRRAQEDFVSKRHVGKLVLLPPLL